MVREVFEKFEEEAGGEVKKKEGKKVKDAEMRILRMGLKGEKYIVSTPTTEYYEDNWKFKTL